MDGCNDKEQKVVLDEYILQVVYFSSYDLNIIKIGVLISAVVICNAFPTIIILFYRFHLSILHFNTDSTIPFLLKTLSLIKTN